MSGGVPREPELTMLTALVLRWAEAIMNGLFTLTFTMAMLGGAVATAAEFPTYEHLGFPITPHQFSLLGSANVQERSPTSTLTLDGMPASPHQILVLTPRARIAEGATAKKLTEAASSNRP